MATGSITLTAASCTLTDGAASNAAPAIGRHVGTESDPKKYFMTLDFDAATDEHAWWGFVMPDDYASGGSLDIVWFANATSGTVRWGTKVSAVTAGDADTLLEHASAAAATGAGAVNATEANRVSVTTISLTMDSAAADDWINILVYRDADGTSGTDDCAVDARFVGARFTYTTV